MELSEKLQTLRKEKNRTQELAEKLLALSAANGAAVLVPGSADRPERMKRLTAVSLLPFLFLCGFILNQQPHTALFAAFAAARDLCAKKEQLN